MFGVRDQRDGPQTEDFSHRIYRGDLFCDQIELKIPEEGNTKVRFTCFFISWEILNLWTDLSKIRKGKMLNKRYAKALF